MNTEIVSKLCPWLAERDVFTSTKTPGVSEKQYTFTRSLPAPEVDYRLGWTYFTDGTHETSVTAIRRKPYCVVELRTESGKYLDTFYCDCYNTHLVRLAAYRAFSYSMNIHVSRVSHEWRRGSLYALEPDRYYSRATFEAMANRE